MDAATNYSGMSCDATTNFRITAQSDGTYEVNYDTGINYCAQFPTQFDAAIYKDGTYQAKTWRYVNPIAVGPVSPYARLYYNGFHDLKTGDYIELWVKPSCAANTNFTFAGTVLTAKKL